GVFQVLGGIEESRFRLVPVGLRLADGAADVLAVEGGEALAPRHPLAFTNREGEQIGGDPRADFDPLVGYHGAGGGVVDRQGFGGGDQRGQGMAGSHGLGWWRRIATTAGENGQQQAREASAGEKG